MTLKYKKNLLAGVMLMLLSTNGSATGLKVLNIHTEHFSLDQMKYQRLQSQRIHNYSAQRPQKVHNLNSLITVVGNYPAISRKGRRTIVLFDHLSLGEFDQVVTLYNANSECIEVTPLDVTSVICTFVEQIQ